MGKTLDDQKSLCRSSSDLSEDNKYGGGTAYGSIFHQLQQEVYEESTNPCEFISRAFDILWKSWALTIFLVILSCLPIAMVVIGGSHRTNCPKQTKVPIYLLVGGGFGLLKVLLLLWRQKKARDYDKLDDFSDEDDDDLVMSRSTRFTGYILSIFLVTWFILGNTWVFGIWKPNYHQPLHEPQNWCNETVYLFSVYQILICYGLIGAAILVFVIILIIYAILRHRRKRVGCM